MHVSMVTHDTRILHIDEYITSEESTGVRTRHDIRNRSDKSAWKQIIYTSQEGRSFSVMLQVREVTLYMCRVDVENIRYLQISFITRML